MGINRVYKHGIRVAANAYFTDLVSIQIREGVAPQDVKLSTTVGPLRDATVGWIQQAFEMLEGRPDVREKAWSRCEVGPWNLSWESITSKDALTAFVRETEEVRTRVLNHTRVQAPEKRKRKQKAAPAPVQGSKTKQRRSRKKPAPPQTRNRREDEEEVSDIEEPFDAGIEDDTTTPLKLVIDALSLPRLSPPDTESEALLNTPSSSRIQGSRVVRVVNAQRNTRAGELEKALDNVPRGYHYSLRNRNEVGISYNENTETEIDSASGSDLEGEGLELVSDEEDLSEDEKVLCQQLGGLGVARKSESIVESETRISLKRAGRTGGVTGILIPSRLEGLKRGIVVEFQWKKPLRDSES